MGKGLLVGRTFTFGTHTQDTQHDVSPYSSIYADFKRIPMSVAPTPTSLLVKFDDLYLINHLTFQLPSTTGYVIHISKDNKNWNKLINYTKYKCDGEQRLCVPKQAAR